MPTKIQWCEETWNPVVGCFKCSPGCDHCYAERMAKRLRKMRIGKYQNVVDKNGWTGDISFDPLDEKPLFINQPKIIFVTSMGDIFHESVLTAWLDEILVMTRMASHHKYLFLTKRPNRMKNYFRDISEMPENIWCGVTVCNQKEADEKISVLMQIPAAVRFVSIEPMLGPIDLSRALGIEYSDNLEMYLPHVSGQHPKLDWVIVGGESGPGARPMYPDWVKLIRDQCAAAEVPFFFKQWGEWAPGECVEDSIGKYKTCYFDGDEWIECSDDWISEQDYGPIMYRTGKKKAGRLFDGKMHDEYPG